MNVERLVPGSRSTHESVYRERIVEHLLVSKLLLADWRSPTIELDVLRPEADRLGYDLVVMRGRVVRYLQIKCSDVTSPVARQKVHVNLLRNPDGCVVWVVVDQALEFRSFRVLIPPVGAAIGERDFPVARHTKANTKGEKTRRPNIRVVPRSAFERLSTFDEVFARLFPGVPAISA